MSACSPEWTIMLELLKVHHNIELRGKRINASYEYW